jgi:hypothetical protein
VKPLTIDVTQEDIERGYIVCRDCPIELAVMRADKTINFVKAGKLGLIMKNNCYALPSIALEFIEKFDNGHKVEPFSFEIIIDK